MPEHSNQCRQLPELILSTDGGSGRVKHVHFRQTSWAKGRKRKRETLSGVNLLAREVFFLSATALTALIQLHRPGESNRKLITLTSRWRIIAPLPSTPECILKDQRGNMIDGVFDWLQTIELGQSEKGVGKKHTSLHQNHSTRLVSGY